ncbi:diacylglycerol/lipid kinase family protein [Pseudomonas sp. MPB23]|uniref:diacylglycerol/lipid kinase family protein n=1 Tax=Pseudomonas sp. MPB23 TaxID=3388490 RepID=UPI0039856046
MNINLPSIAQPRCIGVLINPLSGRVRRQRVRMYRLIHRLPRARVAQVQTPAEIDIAIASWALMENDLLVVIGGDGTLQAALTSLLQTPGANVPKVFIVPAGTTNMSANAIGLRGSPLKAIKALTRWLTHDDHTAREKPTAVLQVSDSHTQRAQCGLFFGAGSIVTGVRYFHERVRPTGLKGLAGPLTAFVRMLLALFSRTASHLLPTVNAAIRVNDTTCEAPWLLVLATTLDKLLLGSTPFWGTEQQPMRLTAIAQAPARLCRALPAVLRGRPSAAMRRDPGYLSHNTQNASIDHLHEYLLDGEIFPVSGTLEIKASPPVRFITL